MEKMFEEQKALKDDRDMRSDGERERHERGRNTYWDKLQDQRKANEGIQNAVYSVLYITSCGDGQRKWQLTLGCQRGSRRPAAWRTTQRLIRRSAKSECKLPGCKHDGHTNGGQRRVQNDIYTVYRATLWIDWFSLRKMKENPADCVFHVDAACLVKSKIFLMHFCSMSD